MDIAHFDVARDIEMIDCQLRPTAPAGRPARQKPVHVLKPGALPEARQRATPPRGIQITGKDDVARHAPHHACNEIEFFDVSARPDLRPHDVGADNGQRSAAE